MTYVAYGFCGSLEKFNSILRQVNFGERDVLYVLGDLAEEDRIYCDCEDGKGDYLVETTFDGIRISCKKCGAAKDICCVGSTLDTQAVLDCTDLYLQKTEPEN